MPCLGSRLRGGDHVHIEVNLSDSLRRIVPPKRRVAPLGQGPHAAPFADEPRTGSGESIASRAASPFPTLSIILMEMEPSDEKTTISAQVPVPLRDELARLARHHDLSLSDEIRRAVRLHLRVEAPGVLPSLRPVPAVRDGTSQAGQSSPSMPAGSGDAA